MITSFFIPDVSGKRFIFPGSNPVTQAAVPSNKPAAAPLVTYPASAPVISAIISPARACICAISTQRSEACRMASATSGCMIDPLNRVAGPTALIMGSMPNS